MTRFRLSGSAQSDLVDIRLYIAEHDPAAADRQMERFFRRFHLLGRNPEMGEMRLDLGPQLRVFSVGNYVIVFRPIDDGIEVARVVSGFRDLGAALDEAD